ncbi:MAG: hypothetical protein OEU46_12475 [Alphaproteobacteria bacterium]|nr:hypothetical protein [Alphaproteobacteria bacterium]
MSDGMLFKRSFRGFRHGGLPSIFGSSGKNLVPAGRFVLNAAAGIVAAGALFVTAIHTWRSASNQCSVTPRGNRADASDFRHPAFGSPTEKTLRVGDQIF